MYNLIMADLYKLRKSKAIKILLAITTICAIIVAILSYRIAQGKLSAESFNGVVFMFGDVNVMSILGAVAAGILICGDFDNRTIHEAIAGGCSRGQVIASKAVSFCFAIVIILIPYVIMISIGLCTGSKFSMGSMSVGLMHILTTGGGKTFSSAEVWKTIAVIIALLIVYIAQLSICIPFALCFKKPVIVVAVYFGLVIIYTSLAALRSTSKVVKNVFDCTPFGNKYNLLTFSSGTGDIVKAIIISVIFTILMLAISYLGFRKSEIK